MWNPPLLRDFARGLGARTDERNHLDSRDVAHGLEMLDAERSGPRKTHLQVTLLFSKIMRPAAVFDAGTW